MQAVLHRVGGALGPQVVFLHGFGADRLSWLGVAPPLQDLAEVFAVDLPGHGDAGDDVGQGTAAELAMAVESAVAGLAGPLLLVGHSLGGLVALHLAARDPGRFRILALVAPAGMGGVVDAGFLRAFPRLGSQQDALALLLQMVVKPRHIAPGMAAHVLASLARPSRRTGLARIADALIAAPPLSATAAGNARIVWGAEDRILPPPAGLNVRLLPGVGHLPQVEAASAVQRALREALVAVTVPRA